MSADLPGAGSPPGAQDSRSGLWSYDGGWQSPDGDIPPAGAVRRPRTTGTGRAAELADEDAIPPGRRRGTADGAGRRGAEAPGHPEDDLGDPESTARAICLRLLTGQPRTRAELAAALVKRGVPDDAAETVLGRFTEVGLVDDRAFAAAWVDSRHAGRGLSRRALAAELRRRGVAGDVVGEAVAMVDADAEERAARQLVDRRLAATRRLDTEARLRRLVGMLARRGYPPGLALRVVRDALAAEGSAPGELDDAFGDDGDGPL